MSHSLNQNNIIYISFFTILAFLFLHTGNTFYDEDGASLIYGSITLNYDTFKYNLSAQPLIFYLGNFIYNIFGEQAKFLYYFIALLASLNFLICALIARDYIKEKSSIILFALVFVSTQELIFSGLYYNTHVLAAFFLLLTLYFTKKLKYNTNHFYALICGTCFALSVFARIDFCLYAILLTAYLYDSNKYKKKLSVFFTDAAIISISTLSTFACLAVLTDFSLLNLQNIIEHMSRTMSDSSYWPKEKNLYVFSILFNYVTYGLLIISLCFSSLKYHAKKKHLELFLYILGIIAALYPTKNFTSPTYALGLMYFAIIFILFNLSQYNIAKKYYFAICGLLLLHILIPMGPKIGTHDGYRYYSGYLSEYTKLKPNEELIPRNRVGTNKIIANILLQEQKNVDFIYGDPARWLWTSFQFGIPVFLLEKGCHIISKEQIGCGNFSVTFTNKKSYTNFNNVTIKIPNDPSLSKVEAENTFLHNTITSLGLPPTYKLRKERNVKTNLKANKICFEEKNSAVLDYQPFNSKDYKFTAQIRLGKESKSDKLILQVDRHGPSPREGIGKIIKITPEFKSYELSHNFQKDHKYVRFVLKNPSNEKICFYIEDIEFLTTQNK